MSNHSFAQFLQSELHYTKKVVTSIFTQMRRCDWFTKEQACGNNSDKWPIASIFMVVSVKCLTLKLLLFKGCM